ncbi:sulfite exporter TauE/SafE family protein [Halalkalibacterium halodurans]|uniref:sulfite exporter TauE/SafE family protein n=1 Tax=Halalkalibacterium halodurans TaxID=86665 RepID=UPI002AA9B5B6|nr:TSUP family transporter [Halalkalibacterium halodurans]MDY7222681.1 TSUP family transporter [Halalkalibacterium halodurans]MDY7241902.1 TSUP family transporter [Halalkalibacterium halodurans]MED4172272.1 TSUP family transporter [Halalkalibacterium halodurans]
MGEISIEVLIFLLASGFVAAFIDSVVGGGGLISIPALLFAGLPPSVALGTNKLAATMGALTSTINFLQSGHINKKLVFTLLPLSIVGSALGVYIVQLIPSEFLRPIILFLLILVTIYTVFKKNWGMESNVKHLSGKMIGFVIFAVLMLGFYDGFLGAGTGSFLIFLFLLLGFNFVESAGNAKVLNLGSNFAALITFMLFQSVHFFYGIAMGIAMIVGAYVGSRVAIKRGAAYVKVLFIGITVTLIGKSIWDYAHRYFNQ